MVKVLIISYYWPPAGGAGVQRWVKLSKYLLSYGIQPVVLTVDEHQSSYMETDTSLLDDIDPRIIVYKTNSVEPSNWYARLVGRKNVPTAGFSNVNNNSLKQKVVNSLRSHLFIPDPRVGWNCYALRKAKQIISEHQIHTVITTSPPHSSQLVGLKLKKKLKIRWIADLRDPWTDIYYYSLLRHSRLSHWINAGYERRVLENADSILTVSEGLKSLFATKSSKIDLGKFRILPNGFDENDFSGFKYEMPEDFTITYSGTMSDVYEPESFIQTLIKIKNDFPETPLRLRIVGKVSDTIRNRIEQSGLNTEIIAYQPHRNVLQYLDTSAALWLVIPNVEDSKGILTGKLFEYLASRKPIICIGPPDGDAASIINECGSGKCFNRMEKETLYAYLFELLQDHRLKKKFIPNITALKKYSRRYQAAVLAEMITPKSVV